MLLRLFEAIAEVEALLERLRSDSLDLYTWVALRGVDLHTWVALRGVDLYTWVALRGVDLYTWVALRGVDLYTWVALRGAEPMGIRWDHPQLNSPMRMVA